MDYRKDTRTPRDRVDDALLSRLLRETDELLADCGCESDSHSHRSGRSARRDTGDSRSCGCDRNRAARRAEERNGTSCGCERNRTDRRSDDRDGSSCGCERNRIDRRSDDRNDNSCGCERNHIDRRSDDRDGNSCGCGWNRTDRRSDDRNDNSCGCGWNRSARNDDRNDSSCGCIDRKSMSIQTQGLPLVMSYCPDHEFHELHEDEEALAMGTLFRELNFPFYASNCSGKCGKGCGCGDEK